MKKGAHWVWAIVALSFLWIAFVYASFYLVQQQRPFGGANVRAIGSTLLDVFTAGAILLVCVGLGRRICVWLGVPFAGAGEELVLGGGVGLGVLSFAVLGMGLLGWLTRWAIGLLVGLLALLSLPDLIAVGRATANVRVVDRPGRWASLFLVTTFVLALLVALTPPVDWDGLFYHLTMPKLYIVQGRITSVTDIPHQYFPGLMEMLYLAAMLLKGDIAAKLLHLGYALLLAGMIYLLARRHLGPKHGWTSVIVYAAIPMVSVLSSWAYNDLALAFYQIAALYAVLNWLEDERRPWLILSALFCGLAMGLKYTAFVCPLFVALMIAWYRVRARTRVGIWLRSLLVLGGVVVLVAAPWYLRNLLFTGNPVYPFAYSVFGGSGWDDWRAAWYERAGSGSGWDPGELLMLPWTLTLGLRDMNFYDGRTGPLFLLALPFLVGWATRLLGRHGPRRRGVGTLLAFALVQCVVWGVGVVHSRSLFQSRLLLPAFAALCAPLAYVFDEVRSLDTRLLSLRRLIGMSVVLVLVANLCYQVLDTVRIHPLAVLVGEESREKFLERRLGAHYAAMRLVNDRVPEDGRVLFLWEPRSYYSQRAVQPDPILERWTWLLHRHGGEVKAVVDDLWAAGYTHVLLYRAGLERVLEIGLDPIGKEGIAALEAFATAYCDEEDRVGDAYVLYRLHADERIPGE